MKKINLIKFKASIIENKDLILFFIFSLCLYFLFFKNIFNSQFNFWNSDAAVKMFPVRVYIYENLTNFKFPFWTERVFLGYPLYLDIENGILNPINILSIILFGPVLSLKILHFLTYLLGSFSIYRLVKKFYPESNIFGGVISVVGFYFSFFHINHLIHMNMVLVSMLLPIHLYFVAKYVEKNNLKYLIAQILLFSYGILWGQPQISFFNFVIVSIFFYYLISNLKISIKYILFIFFCMFCLTLPQLYPSYNVFLNSGRSEGLFKYWEFTNSPTNFLNNLFPYSLGYYQNYQGAEVSGAYSIVETYGYVGIVLFICLIFYLLFASKDKFYKFVISTLLFYLLFTFIGIFFDNKIPLYNDFRYWTRGIFIISFLFLFSTNFFITAKRQDFKLNLFYPLIFVLIFFVSYFFESKDFINFLIKNSFIYLKKIDILIWFVLLITTFLFVLYKTKEKLSPYVFSIVFLFLTIFDLRYFSSDLLPFRISRYISELKYKTPEDCENKRCLLENKNYNGYEFLLFNVFGPFGYSHFIDKDYSLFFKEAFKSEINQSPRSENLRAELDLSKLEKMGFQKIILANGNVYTFPKNDIWILKDKDSGKLILNQEGNYKFEYDSESRKSVELNLKYNSNFNVAVNNQKTELLKDGLFSRVNIYKGKNIIEINYFPYDILFGFLIGYLILFFVYLILKKLKFKIID